MSYASPEFWNIYGEYLMEVSEKHIQALGMFDISRNVAHLDLGCGKHLSALRLLSPTWYLGVDKDPPSNSRVIRADYRMEMDDIQNYIVEDRGLPCSPTFISSLFSSELTASPSENSRFYKSLFERFTDLGSILVSGFYYSSKRSEESVEEIGGIVSFQSIGDLDMELEEVRVLQRVPSKLFGPDVVEVWRLLRKPFNGSR